VKSHNSSSVSYIALERPASVRRFLPSVDDGGYLVSDFFLGDENASLRYLFDDDTVLKLSSLSPIVFYGDKGSGKTALSITLAVRWSRMTGSRPLGFATAKSFCADYASAVEIDDVTSFRSKYRGSKLLVIDDLELIANKNAAQDELVSTIDCLSESDAPLVISIHKLPSTVTGIKPALASRLTAGFSLQLLPPSECTLTALLRAFILDINDKLPIDELTQLCCSLKRNMSVSDIKTFVLLAHQNMNSAKEVNFNVLSPLMLQHLDGQTISIARISKVVARILRVKLSDMRGSTRDARIVRARGLAILLARRMTSLSLQRIGLFFGGRDHSTVLHAFRKTDRLVLTDSELAKFLSDVQTELLGHPSIRR